ncbi:MAG: hypothetical protein ACR2ME_06490 [Acidimicrobiia bacterium]
MTTKRSGSPLALAMIFVTAACGGGGSDDLSQTLNLNEDPKSTLLVVESSGGFVPVEFIVGQGPSLVLQRDGTLVGPGPQIEIYPGPLLANWQESQLDDETMLFVLEELDAMGFVEIDRVENDDIVNVADAPTTTVTFYNQDGPHEFSVYALGMETEVSDARVPILANLVQELYDATSTGGGQRYQPEAIQVVATEGDGLFDANDPTVNFVDWPLPQGFADMGELGIEGWRCATYDGTEAQDLLAIFGEANQNTFFTDGDVNYRLLVRPLFPGEEPCSPVM